MLDQPDPQDNKKLCNQFISNFGWTDSTLDRKARQVIEKSIVEIQLPFPADTILESILTSMQHRYLSMKPSFCKTY